MGFPLVVFVFFVGVHQIQLFDKYQIVDQQLVIS
jgi:hypothetical protein